MKCSRIGIILTALPRLRFYLLIFLVVLTGCSQEQKEEYTTWQTFEHDGVTAKIPDGWVVRIEESGLIRSTGPEGDEVIAWPVFIPGILSPRASHELFQTLSKRVYPGARWGTIQNVGTGFIKMTGIREDHHISAFITLIEQNNRTGGMVYFISAPDAAYREHEETYAGILNSIHIRGPVTRDEFVDSQHVQYTSFNDPCEGAFKIMVPRGWNVTGGADRYAAVDVRKWIRAADPSGDILILYGDTNIPGFVVPNQMLAYTGFPEGTWYPTGSGVNMYVSRYLPGQHFARQYVSQGSIQGCREVRITDARNRSDVVENANRLAAGYGLAGYRFDAGEVRFVCGPEGSTRNGHIIVVTLYIDTFGGMQMWGIESLSGYVATPDKETEAVEVYGKMMTSYEVNPVWHRQQQQVSAQVSRIVSETNAQIFDIMTESYERRSQSQDEIIRKYSNYLRGVEDVRNPEYGGNHTVWSGSNYYWLDNSGTILGTDLHINPDMARFREMIRLD